MLRFYIIAGVFLVCCKLLNGQEDAFVISIPDVQVVADQQVEMVVSAETFDSLVSVQFSLNWDTAIIQFMAFSEEDLPSLSIGINEVEEGKLRFSWFSPDGLPYTLANNLGLVKLRFRGVGETGEISPVDVTDDPLPRQVFRGLPEIGTFYEIDLLHSAGSVTITEVSEIDVTLGSNPVSCFGGDNGRIFFATSVDINDYTFSWTNSSGATITPPLNNLPADTYFLRVTNANNLVVYNGSVVVDGPAAPLMATVTNVEQVGCFSNGSMQVQATGGTAGYTYISTEETNTDGLFTNLSIGNHFISITDANGCQTSIIQEVGGVERPELDYGAPIRNICGVDVVTLGPTGDTTGLQYNWTTGSQSSQLVVTETGEYGVTVSGPGDCISIANYVVTNVGTGVQPVILTEARGVCPGESLVLEVAGGTSFEWLNGTAFLDTVAGSIVTASPLTNFDFEVLVGDGCGNHDTLIVPVEVFSILANAGNDTCVALGLPLRLQASGGIFYEWADNEYPVSNPYIGNPIVEPEQTSTYTVLIEDINGCLTEDEVVVSIAQDIAGSVPAINVITPNGDGDNDVLEFPNIKKFGTNTLRIYNRAGRLVYNKVNYQSDDERFTGDYLNEPLPTGTYFYVLEFRDGTIKQTLSILR